MFTIGEFSKITRLPIKTLRFYHEKGLLIPARVETGSGYRYYNEQNVERARVIATLRSLDVSLDRIAEILEDCSEDEQLDEFLGRHRAMMLAEIGRQREIVWQLDRILETEKRTREIMSHTSEQIQVKELKSQLIAGIRMKGRYSDCGKGFAKLARAAGRHLAGQAFCLFYDEGYREEDADFEPCFPVKRAIEGNEIHCRELPQMRCLSLIHRGPYHEVGPTYQRLIAYAREHGFKTLSPGREVYIKGPGMIFKGNPKRYITEVQIPIE